MCSALHVTWPLTKHCYAVLQLSGKVSCSAVLGELSVALEGGWAGCSPEGLYLVLSLEQVYGGKVTACAGVVQLVVWVDCDRCSCCQSWWCVPYQQKLRASLKELQWSDKPVMHEANLPALASLLHSVTDPLHIVWPVVLAAAHRSTTFSRFWKDVVSGMLTPSLSGELCCPTTLPTLTPTVLQMISATHPPNTSVWPSTWCSFSSQILLRMRSMSSSLPACCTVLLVALPAKTVLCTLQQTSW